MEFTDSLRAALARAREIALECRHSRIAPLHMAIAALEMPHELTADVLRALGVVALEQAAALRRGAPVGEYQVGISGGPDLAYSDAGVRVLEGCTSEAAALGHRMVHPLHLLLAVLSDPRAKAGRELAAAGLGHAALRAAFRAEVP